MPSLGRVVGGAAAAILSIVIVGLGVSSAQSHSAATHLTRRFDLICTGNVQHRSRTMDRLEPYTRRYRVDLGSRRWCEDECRSSFPLAGISATRLTFEESAEGETRIHSFVNRENGYHSSTATDGSGLRIEWTGSCEAARFSGMPRPHPRF